MAPELQKVPPLFAEKLVPTNVVEISKHQTPTSFYKQIDLNEALTISVQFLPCFNLKSTEWPVKDPCPEVPPPESGLTGAGGPGATSASVSDKSMELGLQTKGAFLSYGLLCGHNITFISALSQRPSTGLPSLE